MYDSTDGTHDADEPATGDRSVGSDERRDHRQRVDVDRLGDEIAVLSAQIQAATYELLVRLREFSI